MPLRDLLRPPISTRVSWEGFFGGWPATSVQRLVDQLPEEYVAEPRVRLGTPIEIEPRVREYAYEVLVFDQSRERLLVAAVELVSPGNKDRPESRREFVAKCATLLNQNICVSIVDLVTTRHFCLYAELMEFLAVSDPRLGHPPPPTYAATCRGRKLNAKPRFETWAYPLIVGERLPTLPLWLTDDFAVSLDLEASYEDACRALKIP